MCKSSPSPPQTLWTLKRPRPQQAESLARQLGTSDVLAQILINRDLDDPEKARNFLRPSTDNLHDPFLFPHMRIVVDRIMQAKENGETVLIYGDYDADGVTSTTIMTRGLQALGIACRPFIPDRFRDGYGMRQSAFDRIDLSDVKLLISVDCGITACESAEFLKSKGIDFIITDHHQPEDTLPDALAIIHPTIPEAYPFEKLCGAALALKVILALSKDHVNAKRLLPIVPDLMVLAAIGTVCDVMPLVDENRILVYTGIRMGSAVKQCGLKKLLETCTARKKLSTYTFGFQVGPRINASGRMGQAEIPLQTFLTNNPDEADELLRAIEAHNSERQQIERRITEVAIADTEATATPGTASGIIAHGEEWHEGVIGIVASRLVDRFYLPTIVIAFTGDKGKGSCRAIDGFNMLGALKHCYDYLLEYGGHEHAAGLSISRDQFPAFQEAYQAYCKKHLSENPPIKTIAIDVANDVDSLTIDLLQELEQLEPFGRANGRPIFAMKDVSIAGKPRTMGQGKHLALYLRGQRTSCRAVAWNAGPMLNTITKTPFSVTYHPKINDYNGKTSVEVDIQDIRLEDS